MDATAILEARIEELKGELEILHSQATMLKESIRFLKNEALVVKLSEFKSIRDEYDEAVVEVDLVKDKIAKLLRALRDSISQPPKPPEEALATVIPFRVKKNDEPGS
jgi:hypothetical protein